MTDPFEDRLARVLGDRVGDVRAAPDPAGAARARARRRRRRTASAVAAGMAAVAVVGMLAGASALGPDDGAGAVDTPSPTPDVDLPVLVVDDEVRVGCSEEEPGWPPSVMAEGVPGALSDDEARAAFQDVLDDPGWGVEAGMSLFPDGTDVDYRVLRDNGDSLVVGLGRWTDEGPSRDALTLRLFADGDRWRTDGWGSCPRLSPLLAGDAVWAEVRRARSTSPTRVSVEVTEHQCTSSRDPSPFLHEPVVVEDDHSVTIYWTTTPSQGGFCAGNPSVERTVELAAPLDDRVVLDGSAWPPRVISGS